MESSAAPPFADQLRALREGAGALWLDDRAVITVRGDDRLTWLNGVVTADLRPIALGHGAYTAIVAVKGKLLADAFVHRADDALLVVVRGLRRRVRGAGEAAMGRGLRRRQLRSGGGHHVEGGVVPEGLLPGAGGGVPAPDARPRAEAARVAYPDG
nr:hypothetical protein [Deltaproteobacteria bacterium]